MQCSDEPAIINGTPGHRPDTEPSQQFSKNLQRGECWKRSKEKQLETTVDRLSVCQWLSIWLITTGQTPGGVVGDPSARAIEVFLIVSQYVGTAARVFEVLQSVSKSDSQSVLYRRRYKKEDKKYRWKRMCKPRNAEKTLPWTDNLV